MEQSKVGPQVIEKSNFMLSPISLFMYFAFTLLGATLLFRPSFQEAILLCLADATITFLGYHLIENKTFSFLYSSEYKNFFPKINYDYLRKLPLDSKKDLIESLKSFPFRRALSCSAGHVVKIIPLGLLIVHFWQHPEKTSESSLWMRFIAMEALLLVFFSIAVNLEGHLFLSEILGRLNKKGDFDQAFSEYIPEPKTKRIFVPDTLGILSLAFSFLMLTYAGSLVGKGVESEVLEYLGLSFIGLSLLARLYYINRKMIVQGVRKTKERLNALDVYDNLRPITLQTLPLINDFEVAFNSLIQRLKEKEIETSNLIRYEMENSNYRALGEIAGLVAHDLATPLHSLKFCLSEIEKNPKLKEEKDYIDRMNSSVARTSDLVNALRSHLKGDRKGKMVYFIDIHQQVLKVLSVEFFSNNFKQVEFVLGKEAQSALIGVDAFSLNHILYNTYKNAIQNFIENNIASPSIKISLQTPPTSKDDILLKISDNGTGLARERFEAMTNHSLLDYSQIHRSLGLRLTRRLIESLGGEITVDPVYTKGTCFHIYLPNVKEDKDEVKDDRRPFNMDLRG